VPEKPIYGTTGPSFVLRSIVEANIQFYQPKYWKCSFMSRTISASKAILGVE
jgi:hypothetical protein